MIEDYVVEKVLAYVGAAEGRASVESGRRVAELEVETAQAALDGAIEAFAVVAAEPAAIKRITELQAVRNAARDRLEALGPESDRTLALTAATDWPRLSLDGRRSIIRATVEAVIVGMGRGLDRVSIRLLGE
jgi:hypothetical protein